MALVTARVVALGAVALVSVEGAALMAGAADAHAYGTINTQGCAVRLIPVARRECKAVAFGEPLGTLLVNVRELHLGGLFASGTCFGGWCRSLFASDHVRTAVDNGWSGRGTCD